MYFTTDTPLLSVFCKNWADEGYENDQNYKRDLKAKRPLIYQYETKTKRKMTHGIEEVVNIIYRGSKFKNVYLMYFIPCQRFFGVFQFWNFNSVLLKLLIFMKIFKKM